MQPAKILAGPLAGCAQPLLSARFDFLLAIGAGTPLLRGGHTIPWSRFPLPAVFLSRIGIVMAAGGATGC